VLLALCLIGYNTIMIVSLYDRPLIGASRESRSANEKWGRLEGLLKKQGAVADVRQINFKIIEASSPAEKIADVIPDAQAAPAQKVSENELPVVMGMLKTVKSDGRSQTAVIINNRPFTENDVVSGFMIKQITEKGIYLTKGKRNWFVNTPDISYSMDRGN